MQYSRSRSKLHVKAQYFLAFLVDVNTVRFDSQDQDKVLLYCVLVLRHHGQAIMDKVTDLCGS